MANAEDTFRAAYERLVANAPVVVPKDSRLSQANVAREAGREPSALKRGRYPELVNEIQRRVRANCALDAAIAHKAARSNGRVETAKAVLTRLKVQRDQLASQLVEADETILALRLEVQRLEELLRAGVTQLQPLGRND